MNELSEGVCQIASLGASHWGRAAPEAGEQHELPGLAGSHTAEDELEPQLRGAGELDESEENEKVQRPSIFWRVQRWSLLLRRDRSVVRVLGNG